MIGRQAWVTLNTPNHVHLDHALPIVEIGAEDWTNDTKARIVDDDIKSAGVIHRLVYGVFRLDRVGDVGAHRDDLGTLGPGGLRERLEASVPPCRGDDPITQ